MEATVNQTAANEVMDARIVKLNELKSVKMANLSKGKRPAAKEAKVQAAYILENWDNEFELVKMVGDDSIVNDDIKAILASRLENFADAKEACKKAVEETNQEAPKKEKKAKLTKTQKDLVEKATKSKKVVVEVEKGAGKSATSKKAQPKSEEKKVTKKEESKAAPAPKSTKKVGDIHKNGKWVWTEYQPGKFDWRTIPTMKQKTGAKPKVETEGKKAEKKQTAKKSDKAGKSTAKQTKKGETKKNSPEAPKLLTIDEFVAMPKNARSNKKPSPAQAEALKLINKGYRVTSDKKFFENAEGDKKSCNIDSVVAMFKRYGIDYIPEGLIKK